jgi:DNA polymerase I-like protein with 3'-5' exonuclease and polymerase domains
MRTIAIDTETFRFGEQPDGTFAVIPTMICTTWAERDEAGIQSFIVSDGDDNRMRDQWHQWLESADTLVFHNAAYDLGVCAVTYPELEPLIWDKLERGEITDTKIREKLLNLSSHGNLEYVKLPDGTKEKISYSLADLALSYLGIDMSADKAEDSIRTHYDLYSGMPSQDYPSEARTYAMQDAHVTLAAWEAQQARRKSKAGPASFHTQGFQTACDFALFLMTQTGQRVDAERFHALEEEMAKILDEANLAPCINAGLVRPAVPRQPYVKQQKRALDVLMEEFGHFPTRDTADGGIAPAWPALTEDMIAVLEGEKIKFKAAEKSSLDRKALCARVVKVCESAGIAVKKTATGGVCADAEVIQNICAFDVHDVEPREDLEEDDPRGMTPLENYQYRQAVQKIVTTELPRMTWGPEGEELPAERVFFCYGVLLATGRTSSFASKHYPSGNGQQIDPRARPCYLPEEGSVLLSTDYSALELCSVAQTTYDLFGDSEHRNKINAGMDLHCNLGSSLASRLPSEFTGGYEDFLALKATDPKFFKHWRKFAKPVGLGYPGGLGANTFMSLSKKSYGVDIMRAAMEFPEDQLPGPENTTVAWHAAKIGVTPAEWKWTPFLKGIALSVLLKNVWLETYPEMVAYFDWVTKQIDRNNFNRNIEGRQEPALCYTTPMGMHRAGGTFTAVANGRAMQSPAGEGAKTAVYRLQHETRLGRLRGRAVLHNFIHDEVILSVPSDPADAAEVVEIVEEIMVDSMQNIMPDVRISVESALMERWEKRAEPVRERASGLLVPWTAGASYDTDPDGSLWLPA